MRIDDNRLYYGTTFGGDLVRSYGSPLWVYEEETVRERCRELKGMVDLRSFRVSYSSKANSNVALLRIIREEGLQVDVMSPGEAFLASEAGFTAEEILYVGNNVSRDELSYAIERGIRVSVDSVTQLRYFGELNPGGEVFVRVNPDLGDGHHDRVITSGKVKFGITPSDMPTVRAIAAAHHVTVTGVNMHIGSHFLKPGRYLLAIRRLLRIAEDFDDLRSIDFGGGLGIPYWRADEQRFPIREFGRELGWIIEQWQARTGKRDITFMIEPGRYAVAESGSLLTTVHSIKENFGTVYVGTDCGFNVLLRRQLYAAHHEVIVCNKVESTDVAKVTVCGNICESGDIIAEDRVLPRIYLDDTLAILDAGAYGFSMSSNYNARLRPAEVLIGLDGNARVIREREDLSHLLIGQRA